MVNSKKKGKRYNQEQIIRILDELKSGKTVEEICRVYGVAQSTLYNWKSKYGEMDRDELARLRELEDENRRLKRIVAQQVLDIDALKDLLSKK
jgi:putative transposase